MLKIDDIKQWHPKQSWTRRAFIDSVKKAFEEIQEIDVSIKNEIIQSFDRVNSNLDEKLNENDEFYIVFRKCLFK